MTEQRETSKNPQKCGDFLVREKVGRSREVNIKNYAKYILREGTRDEKREILGTLKTEIVLKDGKIEMAKNLV